MQGWWIADLWNDPSRGPVWVVSWLVWVIGSIVLHELAHGFAALRLGDPTPRDTGHITLNPLVHMGGVSLVLFALVGIAWGAMPIDPSRIRGRHGETIVTLAGPAMNLLLAILTTIALALWITFALPRVPPPLGPNVLTFLYIGAFLNIVLMLFNLLPVPPLDGGRVAAHYIPAYREFISGENGRWVAFGAFLLLFWFAGDVLFAAGINTVNAALDELIALFAPLAP